MVKWKTFFAVQIMMGGRTIHGSGWDDYEDDHQSGYQHSGDTFIVDMSSVDESTRGTSGTESRTGSGFQTQRVGFENLNKNSAGRGPSNQVVSPGYQPSLIPTPERDSWIYMENTKLKEENKKLREEFDTVKKMVADARVEAYRTCNERAQQDDTADHMKAVVSEVGETLKSALEQMSSSQRAMASSFEK